MYIHIMKPIFEGLLQFQIAILWYRLIMLLNSPAVNMNNRLNLPESCGISCNWFPGMLSTEII